MTFGASSKALLVFAFRLLVVFGVLALPWPGWHEQWARVLQAMAASLFTPASGPAEVTFEPSPDTGGASDLRVTMVNRDLMNRDGSGPVRHFDVKVNHFEVIPISLFISLILATPMPWKRRAWQIPLGILLLQAAILAFLALCIWRESIEILLASASPGTKWLATAVQSAGANYLHVALPVILWLVFVFPGSRWREWPAQKPTRVF